MAITLNLQSFVDNMQQQLLEKQDPTLSRTKMAIVSMIDEQLESRIEYHENKIKALKAEDNGNTINAQSIKYHESRLAYYTQH